MKISLANIIQYPNPDLLNFFTAETDIERSAIYERLKESRHDLEFTIIDDQNKRYSYSLLDLAVLLGREDLIEFCCSKYKFDSFSGGTGKSSYLSCVLGNINIFDRLFKYNCKRHTVELTDRWFKEPFSPLFSVMSFNYYPLYTYFEFCLPSHAWNSSYISACYGGNLPIIQHIHKRAAWRGLVTKSLALECLIASIASGNVEAFNYVWENFCKKYFQQRYPENNQENIKKWISASLTQKWYSSHLTSRINNWMTDDFQTELASSLLGNHDIKQRFILKYQQEWLNFSIFEGEIYPLSSNASLTAVIPSQERRHDSIESVEEFILTGNIDENSLNIVQRLLRNSGNNSRNYRSNRTKIFDTFVRRLNQNIPNDPVIIGLMSTIPEFFSYATIHTAEFDEWYIQPLFNKYLSVFLEKKEALTKEEALLCLGFLSSLLVNDASHGPFYIKNLEIIANLLLIPAVRAAIAAHVISIDIGCEYENIFLIVANLHDNNYKTQLLLGIPQVAEKISSMRTRATQTSTGIPIPRVVLENTSESATRPLSPSEQNILEQIKTRYAEKTSNIENAYQECRQALNDRYNNAPIIFITSDKVQISLPLEYKDFEPIESTLPEIDKKAAREAYYAHPVHTAIRFLSEPNLWMADSALWVNRTERVANFSDYLKEICSFWYAVNDESNRITPFDKDGSIDFFVDCLCEAARAHNRDHGTDDKRADAPSCGPGMLRRFIQTTTLREQNTPDNSASIQAVVPASQSNDKPEYTQELFNAAKTKSIYQYYSEKLSFQDTRILVDAMSDPESEDSIKIMRQYDIPQTNIRNFVLDVIAEYRLSTVPVEAILNDLNLSVPHVMVYSQILGPLMNTRYIESIQHTRNKLEDLKGKHFDDNDFDKTVVYLDNNKIINTDTQEKSNGAILSSQQAMNILHDSICHRGFGALPLGARAALGVFAYLFIIPAIVVKRYANTTVSETFFGNPKPKTATLVHQAKTDFEKTFGVSKFH